MFRNLRLRWSYKRVPTNLDFNPYAPSRPRVSILLGLIVCLLVILLVLLRAVIHPVYRFLDDYQRINAFPVVNRPTHPSGARHRAVATTLYTDDYAVAAAVLGHSIRAVNTTAQMVLLYIDGQVSAEALCLCQTVGWETISVSRIPPPRGRAVQKRYEDQYTKLNLWGLDQHGFESVVYLDADTLVHRNFDELFDLPFNLAVVPDVWVPGDHRGFDIAFNAGVLVLKPSSNTLEQMKATIEEARYPSAEAEQAFLNKYYGAKAARLPYIYNANLAIKRRSPVLWDELKSELSIVHYTLFKPFSGVPFPRHGRIDVSTINDPDEWREEVGWWRTALKNMMKNTDLSACSR